MLPQLLGTNRSAFLAAWLQFSKGMPALALGGYNWLRLSGSNSFQGSSSLDEVRLLLFLRRTNNKSSSLAASC